MNHRIKVGIIGDFDERKISQIKTDQCIDEIAPKLDVNIEKQWIPTPIINKQSIKKLENYDGFWAAPGDYLNPSNACIAIQYVREHNIPFCSFRKIRLFSALANVSASPGCHWPALVR